MTGVVWSGASTGQPGQAGQINQFLGTHAVTYIYNAPSFAIQNTPGTGSVASNGLWLAQSFTTGSTTAMGRIAVTLAVTGSPAPMTLGLYADASGAPSGSALVTITIPAPAVPGSAAYTGYPLPYAPLAASSTYWLVTSPVGDATDFYAWSQSNQTSGASTSTDGTAWTAQPYGLAFGVYTAAASGPVIGTFEDGGARWTKLGLDTATGMPTGLGEYTAAQGPGQYVYATRAFTYAAGIPPVLASVA